MKDLVLQYLLELSTSVILPTAIWLIASSHIFSRLRSMSEQNYEERVRETLCDTTVEKICQLLNELFPQYGLTPPRVGASFETIVRNIANGVEAPERLSYLSNFYQSFVKNGIQSPFFEQEASMNSFSFKQEKIPFLLYYFTENEFPAVNQ